MKIITLIENTAGSHGCLAEHGLSPYIETSRHKLLADTGASDAFLHNAAVLGIDLGAVDTVILSHGHYDHAGGILAFTRQNPHAKIWMQRCAKEAYYHKNADMEKYIGIDPQIETLAQLNCIEGNYTIDQELSLFCGVKKRRLWPSGNLELKVKRGSRFEQDEFLHEQYLVLEEHGKKVLISGCAHNGILNILERFRELYQTEPDVVISGFHMMKKTGYEKHDLEVIREIALELKQTHTVYYSGHCTGELPFQILKEYLGNQLHALHSGNEIAIG